MRYKSKYENLLKPGLDAVFVEPVLAGKLVVAVVLLKVLQANGALKP